jgi:hypothetical protein
MEMARQRNYEELRANPNVFKERRAKRKEALKEIER